MLNFDHEKFDVYQISLQLVIIVDETVNSLPKGRFYLADQFLRACSSVPLNIAEGAGEFSQSEKKRFYRMAKRSATECSAILDICGHLKLIKEESFKEIRILLIRIVSMLIKLIN